MAAAGRRRPGMDGWGRAGRAGMAVQSCTWGAGPALVQPSSKRQLLLGFCRKVPPLMQQATAACELSPGERSLRVQRM